MLGKLLQEKRRRQSRGLPEFLSKGLAPNACSDRRDNDVENAGHVLLRLRQMVFQRSLYLVFAQDELVLCGLRAHFEVTGALLQFSRVLLFVSGARVAFQFLY